MTNIAQFHYGVERLILKTSFHFIPWHVLVMCSDVFLPFPRTFFATDQTAAAVAATAATTAYHITCIYVDISSQFY